MLQFVTHVALARHATDEYGRGRRVVVEFGVSHVTGSSCGARLGPRLLPPPRAMRLSSRSTLAAALLPAAVLLTACGTSPLEPTAPATAAAQPQNLSGYVVSWGKEKPQPQNLSGYVVSWGKNGN